MSQSEIRCLWRYIDTDISYEGQWPPNIVIDPIKYDVKKTTPKGVWIYAGLDKKFVLLSARKKFAHPTKEEALDSFIARKKRQMSIVRYQFTRAEIALRKARDLIKEGEG